MGLDIQSKEIIDKISEELKVQPSLKIPRELMDKIQLVYSVNPERLVVSKIGTASDATTVTIHTTHATKRTFLIGAQLTIAKDVVSTSLFSAINIIGVDGRATTFIRIRTEPVTAAQGLTESISLSIPIEVEKSSIINIVNSTATGSIDATGLIYFFEVDPQ